MKYTQKKIKVGGAGTGIKKSWGERKQNESRNEGMV